MNKIKNYICWTLTYTVFFGMFLLILDSFHDENDKFSWTEIITHSCLIGILASLFQQIRVLFKKLLAEKKILSPRWQHQIGEGFPMAIYLFLAMLLFKNNSEIIIQVSSPKLYFQFIFFLLFFVFIVGYMSWKGYDDWGALNKKIDKQ